MKATDAYGRMECSDCKGWFEELRLHCCFYRQERYREEVESLKTKLHKARNLWCDSKRDSNTGFVDIKYLDQFENAIKGG